MAVHSGVFGAVDGASTVREWTTEQHSVNPDWSASNTLQGRVRQPGNQDWSGSFKFNGYLIPFPLNASFSFAGFDGVSELTGTAFAESVEIFADIEGSQPIVGTCAFKGSGPLARTAATYTDSSAIAIYPSIGASAAFNGTPIPDVRSWRLKMMMGLKEYADSSTSGWFKRVCTNFDATASVNIYINTFAALPTMNVAEVLSLIVDSGGDDWLITYAIMNSISDVKIDIDTGLPVSCTLNFAFTGVNASAVVGSVIDPSSDDIWPF